MDFSLNEEQRAWQMKARKFAQEEIRPVSLQRDQIADPRKTFDWELIKKGSKLGFRTAAVPKEWGGHGIDFVTQALVMAELAKGDSAISKAFSQCWKWSHLIAAVCTAGAEGAFLKPFLADDTFVLGKGITEPSAGSDNRLPPKDDPKAGVKLRAERHGDEWILNGEKAFIANGNVGKLFFPRRPHRSASPVAQWRHLVPGAERHARLPHRQGVQQERLALLSERRDDLRERARAARQRRRRGERRLQEEHRRHVGRPFRRSRTGRQCARCLRSRLRTGDRPCAYRNARRQAVEGTAGRSAQDQPDVRSPRRCARSSCGSPGSTTRRCIRRMPVW